MNYKKIKSLLERSIIVSVCFILASCAVDHPTKIDLSGEWSVRLDAENIGVANKWFLNKAESTLQLPGCLQAYGYGEKPGPSTQWWSLLDLKLRHPSLKKYAQADTCFKLVQFLMPRHHYIGAAWYQKEIEIPTSFEGKQLFLNLERCHWESQVWVDGIYLGKNASLAAAHIYNLSQLKPGRHLLSIRIDNGKIVNLGNMPHSVSDQTAGSWNGIVGDIFIEAKDDVYIKKITTYPNIHNKSVLVKVNLSNASNYLGILKIEANATGYNNNNTHVPNAHSFDAKLNGDTLQTIQFTYELGNDAKLWDEFEPNLYKLQLTIKNGAFSHSAKTTFGLREIKQENGSFYVNGVKRYFRGNVDCAVYPKTGYAPMDVDAWRRVFKIHKQYGLNHVRYHSWCPPKAAFEAADELGMYLAPEVHEWSAVAKSEQLAYLKKESAKILEEFGNHASFVLMGLGNESGISVEYSTDILNQWKSIDNRRLYTIKASAGWNAGMPEEMDFEVLSNVGTDDERDRIRTRYQAFWPPIPKHSEFTAKAPQTSVDWNEGIEFYNKKFKQRALLAHETAQFCAYPDVFNEMKKYTGYLRPTYLEIAADQLEERGMTHQLQDFVENSGRWQVLLTREEIEASLRTNSYAGFQWLALNDFTGQNTAPVGFTDAFYNDKPYVSGNDMKQFCDSTVLLARLPKRVFTNDENLKVSFEVFHHGRKNLSPSEYIVTITNSEQKILKKEVFNMKSCVNGNTAIGNLVISLKQFSAPAKYNIKISSHNGKVHNNYDFWLYPSNKELTPFSPKINVCHEWDSKAKDALENGETVLLLPKIGSLKGNLPQCFTTFYWTSFGEKGGQSSACGIMMDNKHPLFESFPTETHANWQWWDLLTQCQPMILDQFEESHPWPKEYIPIIQAIDSWKSNRKLALVVEAKVRKGKLLVCSMDIESNLDKRPVAKQFRMSLNQYIMSAKFNPTHSVGDEIIEALFDQTKATQKLNLQGLPLE
ncbi:glycoside hydrolase family 2 [Labilibacter marinus]|uniref:glycoside hydrolase family 2 n=1 Tax=Labilibacter marinus TaxID=1477105 RepID=UPI0009501832|nr:glycoside hydrolase family 2 [Labilibacter marinus]